MVVTALAKQRDYPTPGVLPSSVRNQLKTKEIAILVCTSVRKRIKTLELVDLFCFGTAILADGADWKKRRGTQRVLYHGCQGVKDSSSTNSVGQMSWKLARIPKML